ncbi:NYN domain-containing protein [Methanospirillum sp. J.3.6.1-F.2.7.3]|uniref:NYN domain-containing protein n=1 Tax=Methanospirillum purgamenti TaxID=2834276 RepID=A0A8E7B002_9EURY|nr:NYN domain-containing protein [Methanospirillum sp. J.3.6.1-F.2.7.3]QVV90545.1 NYN domain-containing protein [Methanospirillum sp. J.3.6.1-F.2.7.3]
MTVRSAVFIDGAYLIKLLESDFSGARIDLEKVSDQVCLDSERFRTYYYDCMPYQSNPPTEEERERTSRMNKFIAKISNLPRFQVKLGKLGKIGTEYVRKRIEVLMSVDIVQLSWSKNIGTIIIISGDGDLVPAVTAARDAGVLVKLWYTRSSIHYELLDAVDEFHVIDQKLVNKIKLDPNS